MNNFLDVLNSFFSSPAIFQNVFSHLISGILVVLAWVGKTLYNNHRESKKPDSHDLDVWQRISNILDEKEVNRLSKQYCGFIPTNNYTKLWELHDILVTSSPGIVFLNKKLELKKLCLKHKITTLLEYARKQRYSSYFETDDGSEYKVLKEFHDQDEKMTKEINDSFISKTCDFVQVYNDLYNLSIRMLINKKY